MIIAIDTETGGTNPERDALLSISACHLINPDKNFTVFIDPDPKLDISAEAAAVNGYTPELWRERGAVPLLEALKRFKAWLPYSGNDPLAHNAGFDRMFLEAAERQTGFKTYLRYRWRCSMALFMGVNEAHNLNAQDFTLNTLARMSGHWADGFERGAHQSIDDVKACAAGWRWLVGLARRGVEDPSPYVAALREISESKAQTLLGRCCVEDRCMSSDSGAKCELQESVNSAFAQSAAIADRVLPRAFVPAPAGELFG